MNNKKLRFTVLSILVLAIVCLAMFSGCKKDKGGDDNGGASTSAAEIFVEKSLQPRLLYVEGQDLDLSSGALTVSKDGEQTRIPFTDPRITITGYDKHTIGDHTLTVSYEGKTTTLTARVIARMTVENVDAEYFIGEAFNKNKGRVKVAKDDATTSYVDMKSDSITVKSFNNTAAGTANVTIQYTNGSASYECSFPVTLYTPDKINFYKPRKDDYFSHEKELNFTGGYLYLEAAKPSTFKKSINITADMVSGYNPNAVTEANKDIAVTQTVTVSYADREWSFDVNVLYSPIYVIEGLESKITNVNLEKEDVTAITLPAGAGAAAKEAIQRYFMLSSADQEKLDSELMLNFARVAAFYVNTNDYVNAVNALNEAFVFDANGNRTYVGKNVQAVENAIEALLDSDSDYNATAAFMTAINEAFGEEQFNSKLKISQLTTPHTEDDAKSIADELQHILDIYDILKDIPSTWNSELSNPTGFEAKYSSDIISVVFKIQTRKSSLDKDYNAANHSKMYAVITGWRADFFEIVYSYYYYVKDGGKDQIYTDLWGTVPAPGLLEEFRTAFDTTYDMGYRLTELYKQSAGNMIGTDISVYHYYYQKTINLSKQIKASGNELYTTIYNAINLDAYINVYLNAPSTSLLGYYDFVGPLVDSETAVAVFDAYYTVFDVYITTGQIASTAENRTKIVALFDAMVNLSPSELHWFLSSVALNYHNFGGKVLMFNFNGTWQDYWLGQLMYGFFLQELPKNQDGTLHNAQAAFANLLQAMEIYPTAQFNEDALTDFKNYMAAVNTQFNELSPTEQTAFRNLAGKALDKYNKIYNDVLDASSISLSTEMNAKFDELYSILDEFYSITKDSDKMKLPAAYPTLMALYQKAKVLYGEICETAETSSAVKNALNAKLYTLEIEDEGETTVWNYTIDSYYYFVKFIAYSSLLPNGHLDYVNSLSNTLVEFVPFLRAELNGEAYENISDIIAIFRSLDDKKLIAFYSINASTPYFSALERYAEAKLGGQSALNPGSLSAKIDEFLALYKEFNDMYTIVYSNQHTATQRSLACTAIIAIYNKTKIVYTEILEAASGDANLMNAVNFKHFTLTLSEGTEPLQAMLDDYFVYMMLTSTSLLSSSEELINAAKVESVQALLIKLIPLLKAEASGTAYAGTDILELLAALRALTPDEKYAFYVLQGNVALYAELERHLEAKLSDAAKSSGIISSLFNAEIYYSLYERNNEDEESVATFKAAMEAAIEAYKSITAEDKALLGDLYYNALLEKYNTLFPAEDTAA